MPQDYTQATQAGTKSGAPIQSSAIDEIIKRIAEARNNVNDSRFRLDNTFNQIVGIAPSEPDNNGAKVSPVPTSILDHLQELEQAINGLFRTLNRLA